MKPSHHNGSFLGRFLTAAVLALGFGLPWYVLSAALGMAAFDAVTKQEPRFFERPRILSDGTILIDRQALDEPRTETTHRLDGSEFHDVDALRNFVQETTIYGHPSPFGLFTSDTRPDWHSGRLKAFRNELDPRVYWYFVHDGEPKGSGCFVGYDRQTNHRVGYIGLSGFRAASPPQEERIPVRGEAAIGYGYWSSKPMDPQQAMALEFWNTTTLPPHDVPPRLVHVPSGNRLRVVDLDAGSVETVFEVPTPILSVGVPWHTGFIGTGFNIERPILVRTDRMIAKLDHQHNLLSTFTLPDDVHPNDTLEWYEFEDGRSIVSRKRPERVPEAFAPVGTRYTFYRVSAEGAIEETRELVLADGLIPLLRWKESVLATISIPSPGAIVAAAALTAARVSSTTFTEQVRNHQSALVATTLLSIGLAVTAWRLSGAFGLPFAERTAWTAFTLFFGVPALVGSWLQQGWPTRPTCPHCRTQSPRDRDSCTACEAPFPTPALQGTEIFA